MTGVKHDRGKPLAATVIAGFWPVLGDVLTARVAYNVCVAATHADAIALVRACDALFDARVDVDVRLVNARAKLDASIAIAAVVDVGSFGARKYAPDNWLHVADGVRRYYEAAGRHFLALARGNVTDPESGLPELGHLVWNISAGATLALIKADGAK